MQILWASDHIQRRSRLWLWQRLVISKLVTCHFVLKHTTTLFILKETKTFISSFQSTLQNPAYTLHRSSKGLCMSPLTAVHLQLYVMESNFPIPSLPRSLHHTNSPLHAASLEHPPDLTRWHLFLLFFLDFSLLTNCQWFLIDVLWFGSSQTLVDLSNRDQHYAQVAVTVLQVLAFFFCFPQSTSLVSTLE